MQGYRRSRKEFSWSRCTVDNVEFSLIKVAVRYIQYKGSGRGRLGAPRPPWRVRVECEEVFVLELSGTHELHTINTTYQVADVRPSGLR